LDPIDTLIFGCYDSAMSKPDIEKLEAGISTLLEVYRQLKEENQKLTLQVEGLMHEGESLSKEQGFAKEKLERLAGLEASSKNNEKDKKQVREKVAHLLEKLEKFDLT
jgi:seryl-tRNA synthetase